MVPHERAKLQRRNRVGFCFNLCPTFLQAATDICSDSLTNRTITVPVLFILATKDAALTPAMSQNMQQNVPNLTRKEVVAGHWALVQAAQQVNTYLQEWFGSVVFEGKSVL